MVRIEIATLRKGLNKLALEATAADLDLDPETFSGILVNAEVDVQSGQILVRFDVTSTAHLVCDRTLKTYTDLVSGGHTILCSSEEDGAAAADTDTIHFSQSDRFIDISDAVRDTLILALPSRRVAPGADDVDLPNRFGEDDRQDAIDPRWEALRRLQR